MSPITQTRGKREVALVVAFGLLIAAKGFFYYRDKKYDANNGSADVSRKPRDEWVDVQVLADESDSYTATTSSSTSGHDGSRHHNPGHEVAHIYELLEGILLHLPPKDVLLSQLVSHTFHDVASTSQPLKNKFQIGLPTCRGTAKHPAPLPLLFETVECRWTYNPSYPYRRQRYVLVRIDPAGLQEQAKQKRRTKKESWRDFYLTDDGMRRVVLHATGTNNPLLSSPPPKDPEIHQGNNIFLPQSFTIISADPSGSQGRNLPTIDPLPRRGQGYRLKLHRSIHEQGVKLGDLADMASELWAMDESVQVQFSVYLDAEGKGVVQDWERFGMVEWEDGMSVLRRGSETAITEDWRP